MSEHSSAAPHTTVYHAYNDQSYTPLARIECTDNPLNPQRAIYYTHSSLSGLPEALTNSDGEIVWQGQYSAWGHLQRQTRPTSTFNREQNLRFQGQYFDKETGLHYNTFRYYAPDLGRFTQQDPIGLAGGINLYAYAPNALTWVDPWGWASCKPERSKHALQRHKEGRPIGQTINDLQNARSNDILRQSDGRWVVLGPKGRAHIIEKDGSEIITSMRDISKKNVQHRMNRSTDRWERLTQSELDEFRDIFSDYVRF
ncbi:TPA: RHS repeat-associated core domain-containing protein [Proteus mirabilis]